MERRGAAAAAEEEEAEEEEEEEKEEGAGGVAPSGALALALALEAADAAALGASPPFARRKGAVWTQPRRSGACDSGGGGGDGCAGRVKGALAGSADGPSVARARL